MNMFHDIKIQISHYITLGELFTLEIFISILIIGKISIVFLNIYAIILGDITKNNIILIYEMINI